MNSSKISLPSSQFITIYIWFIHLTSFLSWTIVPFLFYTILTQSKGLANYKWFILNHSFWSLAFETMIGFFVPMILLPAFGGIPLTLLRENGSMHATATAAFMGCIFGVNYAASIFVTIGTRYFATFSMPHRFLSEFFTQRTLIFLSIGSLLTVYPIGIYHATTVYTYDSNITHANAVDYDNFFINFDEPSLIFFSVDRSKFLLLVALLFLNIDFFGGIFVIILFIYLVRNNDSKSVTKIQRSLIISSVVQILLSELFLILPIIIIDLLILFEIPRSTIYGCICISLISAHSALEFLATLYFVLPYRKFKNSFQNFGFQNPLQLLLLNKVLSLLFSHTLLLMLRFCRACL